MSLTHTPQPKPVVRTWCVKYHEPGYLWSEFQRWFMYEHQAKAFAQRHDMPMFHPVITHVPYGTATN